MSDENDPLRQLEFYRRRVNELAGQAVRADFVVSRARRELKQRRQGFALLSELHGLISTDMLPDAIFSATLERLERQLKMERMVILRREGDADVFRPCFTRGFPADAALRLLSQTVAFPPSLVGSVPLLVTNATPVDDFVPALKQKLETPFFVCAPISEGDKQNYFLLAGRMREAKPFFPPLDEGDVYTIQSLAGFIGAALHNSALFAHTQRMARSFARFVPSEFLEFLSRRSIVDVELGDQTQQVMTILFSDIRSFTSLSERMTPAETFAFINRYLRQAAPVIREHGGFIDKFIGDAIMALFPGDCIHAIRAANALHAAVSDLNTEWTAEGKEAVKIGVGLHTGLLMLGTIGFAERMEGTVISDAVNLASRVEGMTKQYGAPVLVSGETMRGVDAADRASLHVRLIDRVQAVGKAEPVDVYEVFDALPATVRAGRQETLACFELAFRFWQAGDFARALAGFDAVLAANPDDKAAALHHARCRRFLREGSPPDWNGVMPLDQK